jgi:hypothetical protein
MNEIAPSRETSLEEIGYCEVVLIIVVTDLHTRKIGLPIRIS